MSRNFQNSLILSCISSISRVYKGSQAPQLKDQCELSGLLQQMEESSPHSRTRDWSRFILQCRTRASPKRLFKVGLTGGNKLVCLPEGIAGLQWTVSQAAGWNMVAAESCVVKVGDSLDHSRRASSCCYSTSISTNSGR